ncbi:MAG: glycosyltransferase family 4 protein [Steroidobacteraceae bacterium]
MNSVLVLFHCDSNVGYAIAPLERTFYEMALSLCDGDASRVHFAYKHMDRGPSPSMPAEFHNYVVMDSASTDPTHHAEVRRYIRETGIDVLFGFDQGVSAPLYGSFRRAGVRHFVSYWGAPMSSENGLLKRSLKRLEVALRRNGPDHYVFESHGMARLATHGRGIPPGRISVVHLGVDTGKFRPDPADVAYVYEQFGIPRDRRVFFYSGHFEPRKGVAVIMEAANRLAREDWHIVLCGNKGAESVPYEAILSGKARGHITFAGYRNDLDRLQRGCYAAVIASSGWDSFPRSGMEMQATGLPLLASDLIGLREAIEDGVSGFLFRTGDGGALAKVMQVLLNDPSLRDQLSRQARERIERSFSLETQLSQLIAIMRHQVSASLPIAESLAPAHDE